ncbi:MAG: WYL domain-containing protein, partial [Planctomycetes bacterium]|nr:WYL domain-containing protein [Planctomycetota bacterium]
RVPSEPEKRWKIEETFLLKLPNLSLPDLNLTREEIILLNYLISQGSIFRHTDIEKYLFTLQEKLKAFLPHNEQLQHSLSKLDDIFIPSGKLLKNYSGKEEIIDDLIDSILLHKTCLIIYHAFSTDKTKTFYIHPLKLFEHDGGLYVFVRIVKHDSIRIVAIERIQKLTVLQEIFEYPSDFNPEKILDSAFTITFSDPITAKIWFSPDQAKYII